MITALLVGIIVGFALAIPPGPIAIAVMKKAFDGQYREGFQMGLGAALLDVFYALLASFASSALVVALRDVITGSGWLTILFQAICIIVLIVFGARYMRTTGKTVVENAEEEAKQEAKAKRLGLSSPLLVGILLAITNLANPTFLPSLIFVASYLHTQEWVGTSLTENIFFAIGFGVGVALWFVALLRVLIKLRDRLPPRFIPNIYKFAGGTFILSAIILTYHVAMETDWANLP